MLLLLLSVVTRGTNFIKLTTGLTTDLLQDYYRITSGLLQIYYTKLKISRLLLLQTFGLNASRGGFNIFNFTDNFQIDNVPGSTWKYSDLIS